MSGLNEEEQALVNAVKEFVGRDVLPVVGELEHDNIYPEKLIETMKELGLFGLTIDEPYSPGRVSTACFARVSEELARGWVSLAGAMGSHSVIAYLIGRYGTQEQKEKYLPGMATGEIRSAMGLTEPGGGSDLQSIRTVARRDGDDLVINGSKMWITNARRAGVIGLLVKTDPEASPAHRGMSIVLVEPGAGFTVSRDLKKLGYKGIETCELSFEDYRTPATQILGGQPGLGFKQMMGGLEIGRIQVAARACGIAGAAFDEALKYAQERETFGLPIWKHQSIGNYLAEMATKLRASRLLVRDAAESLDRGERSDMEAGMAKLYATETAAQITLDAMRVHGGYGYSLEFPIERYFREAPLFLVGEGTNEMQKNVIAKQLVDRGGVPR
ncbi:acyl-CoA dehydrogenase family protein [Nocardia sp. NPDC050799]|uniref:acyl-CoA dehydrogenase family protein n=1 Tax=Nocardia sp. NPDC050799 TaxID=3154842 RepID=UPI0033C9E5EE